MLLDDAAPHEVTWCALCVLDVSLLPPPPDIDVEFDDGSWVEPCD